MVKFILFPQNGFKQIVRPPRGTTLKHAALFNTFESRLKDMFEPEAFKNRIGDESQFICLARIKNEYTYHNWY
jgi:hypothetical protein